MGLLNSFWGCFMIVITVGALGVTYFLIKDMCDDLNE
jgi:hypothetical protein